MTIYQGKISSGFGKGKSYLEKLKPVYGKYLELDYFCGTLNVIADKDLVKPDNTIYISEEEILPLLGREKIEGKRKGCYFVPAKFLDENVFIIQPEHTDHPLNILEIISESKLREKYNLKDGDNVVVTVD